MLHDVNYSHVHEFILQTMNNMLAAIVKGHPKHSDNLPDILDFNKKFKKNLHS
jgi:hypothetical protein